MVGCITQVSFLNAELNSLLESVICLPSNSTVPCAWLLNECGDEYVFQNEFIKQTSTLALTLFLLLCGVELGL
jgi:hypothetical protein